MKGIEKMKRIISILILISILVCSLASCGGGEPTEKKLINSTQEAIDLAKYYCDSDYIAKKLGFTRLNNNANYFKEEAVLNDKGDGNPYYSVTLEGRMFGQEANYKYSTKEFWCYLNVFINNGQVMILLFDQETLISS